MMNFFTSLATVDSIGVSLYHFVVLTFLQGRTYDAGPTAGVFLERQLFFELKKNACY
jgi:hypothetical protein